MYINDNYYYIQIFASIIVNEFITSMLSGAHRVQRTKEHVTL